MTVQPYGTPDWFHVEPTGQQVLASGTYSGGTVPTYSTAWLNTAPFGMIGLVVIPDQDSKVTVDFASVGTTSPVAFFSKTYNVKAALPLRVNKACLMGAARITVATISGLGIATGALTVVGHNASSQSDALTGVTTLLQTSVAIPAGGNVLADFTATAEGWCTLAYFADNPQLEIQLNALQSNGTRFPVLDITSGAATLPNPVTFFVNGDHIQAKMFNNGGAGMVAAHLIVNVGR